MNSLNFTLLVKKNETIWNYGYRWKKLCLRTDYLDVFTDGRHLFNLQVMNILGDHSQTIFQVVPGQVLKSSSIFANLKVRSIDACAFSCAKDLSCLAFSHDDVIDLCLLSSHRPTITNSSTADDMWSCTDDAPDEGSGEIDTQTDTNSQCIDPYTDYVIAAHNAVMRGENSTYLQVHSLISLWW